MVQMVLNIWLQYNSNPDSLVPLNVRAFSYAALALSALASASAVSFCSRSALRSNFCSVTDSLRVRRRGELAVSAEGFRTGRP